MWYLRISEEEFEELYPDGDISLFKRNPENDEDFIANFLPNKLWRLNNLYTIIDKDGNKVLFNMNRAQHRSYSSMLRHPRVIILKSRQQGISTFWLIDYFDDGLFIEDLNIGMLAQGLEEASTLLERVKIAWDNLNPAVKEFLGIKIVKDNSKEYSFSNGSTIFIRTSFRSATLQRLHVSEMGKIAAKDPQKARELVSGTMQAIKAGNPVVIESTAEGRKNQFHKMWYSASDFVGQRGLKDFKPLFLSWVDDPDCVAHIPQSPTQKDIEYIQKVERDLDIVLTNEQQWWVIVQRRESGDDFDQEYPYDPESAFAAVRDGAYYATQWKKEGRIVIRVDTEEEVREEGSTRYQLNGLYDPALDVFVAFDLGVNDTQVLIYWQELLRGDTIEIRVIRTYYNSGEGIDHYYRHMKNTGYAIAGIYLPHDIKVREWSSAKSRYRIMRDMGMKHLHIIPKTTSRTADIGVCRLAIKHVIVDASPGTGNDYFIDMFYNYSKEWNEKLGVWRDIPLHDEWSNPADAWRYLVFGRYASKVGKPGKVKKPRKKSAEPTGMAL